MSRQTSVLEAQNLTKIYRRGSEEILALDNVSLVVRPGEFLSFVGPSGSGKTTLINILGGLDNATSGRLKVGGRMIFDGRKGLSESELTRIRRQVFGYIFQKFYLVPTLTVEENVLLPFAFFKKPGSPAGALGLLKSLGLEKRTRHRPAELSGGEMQRVAIARSLANQPRLILADEPTGNLDSGSGGEIIRLFNELAQQGHTIVVITHDNEISRRTQRIIKLRDGLIVDGQ